MPQLYHLISKHFHALFWPLLAGTFLLAFIQLKDQSWLQNEKAPDGIVSLELGAVYSTDSAIIASWKKDTVDNITFDECQPGTRTINRLHVASREIGIDNVFVLFYTALAIVIIAALQARRKPFHPLPGNILIALALIAGICDWIENYGMLRFINQNPAAGDGTASLIANMAWIKFSILGSFLIFYLPFQLIFRENALKWLSSYLRDKAIQLFQYRVILVSVLFFTIPIWVMDQGQDLLVNSNSSDIGVFLFMTVVLIAAALNWWLSKLFFDKDYKDPLYPFNEPKITDPSQLAAEKKVSRYLGIITIVIPAVAILNALQVLQLHFPLDLFPPILWLIALLAIFYVLVKFDIACRLYTLAENRFGHRISSLFTKLVLVLLAFILPLLRLSLSDTQSVAPSSLFWLFGHLILLATAFWIFVSTRNNIFSERGWFGKKIGWPIAIGSFLLITGFILFNVIPLSILSLDCNYLSLPLLLSGIIFYILLFTILIRLSLRTGINFVLFIVAGAIVIAATAPSDYHAVRTVMETDEFIITHKPVPLDAYFKGWLRARQAEIDSVPGEYPIFLVNTYGGGIKAAAFTNMAVSWLDAQLINTSRNHKGFEHYVFSYSGASGGTIGAAVQCAYRGRHLDSSAKAYDLDSFRNFYRHDFLTPVLGSLLGRDILGGIIPPAPWADRSDIQEEIWTGFGKKTLGIDLGQRFDRLWDTTYANPARWEVPLLFSNTLNVDDGLKGIMTAVTLPQQDFPGTIFVRDRIIAKDEYMPLATGAFLSARFPFISPSGKMGPGYHFMDGGAKDNSGASTSEAIFLSLARTATRCIGGTDTCMARLVKKCRFYFVSITNSPYYDPDTRKLVANRFEPISPLVGIINSGIYGNAQTADETLKHRYAGDSTQFPGISPDYCSIWITGVCISDGRKGMFKPVLPLGWQISEPSLDRMRRSFDPDMLGSYNSIGAPKILKILAGR